eukprot:204080-Rhodomonas_salina.4
MYGLITANLNPGTQREFSKFLIREALKRKRFSKITAINLGLGKESKLAAPRLQCLSRLRESFGKLAEDPKKLRKEYIAKQTISLGKDLGDTPECRPNNPLLTTTAPSTIGAAPTSRSSKSRQHPRSASWNGELKRQCRMCEYQG